MECRSGPDPVFSKAEEDAFVEYCCLMARIGYGLTKKQLLQDVSDIVKKDGRPNPFTNDMPGKSTHILLEAQLAQWALLHHFLSMQVTCKNKSRKSLSRNQVVLLKLV